MDVSAQCKQPPVSNINIEEVARPQQAQTTCFLSIFQMLFKNTLFVIYTGKKRTSLFKRLFLVYLYESSFFIAPRSN